MQNNKYSPPNRHGKHHRQNTGRCCSAVLQSVFIVMVFVADTHCSTFIFLKCKKKIKELQAFTQTKTHAKKTA
jgi:hypothetical protein